MIGDSTAITPFALSAPGHVLTGRAQMGSSLGFHIVFASIGVGLPVLMVLAEGLALRSGDAVWLALARRWSKAFAILFAVGAVSGTIISFELGLLWPTFMRYAGGIIGLPFSLEGFAFFIEAIFLGIYLYGWERLSPRAHWLSGILIAISGSASAFFVVTANAWMNDPTGFRLVHGRVTDVNPIAAMFNPTWPTETSHMMIAAIMATAFGVAAVYAAGMLRGRRDSYHRGGLALALAVGAIFAPVEVGVGDLLGRTVAHHQPAKLAAMEGIFNTEKNAPLNLGGFPVPGEDRSIINIKIPDLLGLLAFDNPDATARGLKSFPVNDRPSAPLLIRLSFQGMVGIGTGLMLLGVWFWLAFRRGRRAIENRWLLRSIVAAGPLAFAAIELGWIVTEVGRQPWIVYGLIRTKDAVTTSPGLGYAFTGFTLLYIGLATMTVWLLRRLAQGAPKELHEKVTA
jgi:cytochrome d ubiquinol oxidase subunit I